MTGILIRKEIGTHRESPGMHAHGGDPMWGHSEDAATCKSRRQAWGKSNHFMLWS